MLNTPFHIKDIAGYVFFSERTTGKTGKPVKIHSSLFIDFFCAVDPTTHDGQVIIRDIENLKVLARPNTIPHIPLPQGNASTARHNAQMQKVRTLNNAMAGKQECSLVTKNVRVFYHIHQNAGDVCPTVYISEVQVLHESNNSEGGLYEYKSRRIGKVQKRDLDGRLVMISQASASPEEAMESAVTSLGNKAVVFFNPKFVANDLSISRSNRLSEKTRSIINELADVLKHNQKKSVAWLVDGAGAAVLSHALKKVQGGLEKHSFRFRNARVNLSSLMNDLTQRKAQLNGEFITYDGDKVALMAIAIQKQALLKQIGQLPSPTGYEKITRRYLIKNLEGLGSVSWTQKVTAQPEVLRSSKATFLSVLISIGSRLK